MTADVLAALDVPDPRGNRHDRAAFFAALDDLATQVRYRARTGAHVSDWGDHQHYGDAS